MSRTEDIATMATCLDERSLGCSGAEARQGDIAETRIFVRKGQLATIHRVVDSDPKERGSGASTPASAAAAAAPQLNGRKTLATGELDPQAPAAPTAAVNFAKATAPSERGRAGGRGTIRRLPAEVRPHAAEKWCKAIDSGAEVSLDRDDRSQNSFSSRPRWSSCPRLPEVDLRGRLLFLPLRDGFIQTLREQPGSTWPLHASPSGGGHGGGHHGAGGGAGAASGRPQPAAARAGGGATTTAASAATTGQPRASQRPTATHLPSLSTNSSTGDLAYYDFKKLGQFDDRLTRTATTKANLRKLGFPGVDRLDLDPKLLLDAKVTHRQPDGQSARALASPGVEHLEAHQHWRAELTKGSVVYVLCSCGRWVRATVHSARDEDVSVHYGPHHRDHGRSSELLSRSSVRLRFCAPPPAAQPQPKQHEEEARGVVEDEPEAAEELLEEEPLQAAQGPVLDKYGNSICGPCAAEWARAQGDAASTQGGYSGVQLDKYSDRICGRCLVLLSGVYNGAAVKGEYGSVATDRYGNPDGGGYDLAADGSFEGYKVLVGNFFTSYWERLGLEQRVMPQLAKKGFIVKICCDVDSFVGELRSGQYHVAWIISHNDWTTGDQGAFVSAVRDFHRQGHGLMIWADNDPYFCHANLVLRDLFGFRLTGNTPGGKPMRPGLPTQLGCFDKGHKVCAGLSTLYEGITICYPDSIASGWEVFGTSTDGKPAFFAKDASLEKGTAGRVMVDCGFTKLMEAFWDTAGTPRYVSNCTAWLALRERFLTPHTKGA